MKNFKINTYNYSLLLLFVAIAVSIIFYLNYIKNLSLCVIISCVLIYFIFKYANKNRIKTICKIEDNIEILYIENYMRKSYKCNINNIKAFCIEISAEINAKNRHFTSKIIIVHNNETKEFIHENYDIYFLNNLLKNANNLPNFSCKLKINNLPMVDRKIKSIIKKYNNYIQTD